MTKRSGSALRAWRLAQLRNGRRMTLEAAATMVGVTRSAWNDWEKGKRTPGQVLMRELYTLTGGAVTPNDFYELPDLDAQEAA